VNPYTTGKLLVSEYIPATQIMGWALGRREYGLWIND